MSTYARTGGRCDGCHKRRRISEHEITYTHDADGNITGHIDEVEIFANATAQRYLEITETFKPIGYGLTFVKGMDDYAKKCRIGTNGKVYFPKNKNIFYGNQHVRTSPITTMRYLKALNRAYDVGENVATFEALYEADGHQLGYNSRKYLAHVAGREIGSNIGSKIGIGIGEGAGAGVLSVPLGIVLGIAGDYIGGEIGGNVSDFFFDLTY